MFGIYLGEFTGCTRSGRSQQDSIIDDCKWPIPDTLGSPAMEGSALEPADGTSGTGHMHVAVVF